MNKTFKFFVDTTFLYRSKIGTKLMVLLPACLFAIGFALLFAEGFRRKPFEIKGTVKPRPTHAQLQEKRKEVQTDGKIAIAEEPIKLEKIRSGKTESLIKRSVILSHGPYWTLVPKGAILHVPGHLTKRVGAAKKGKLVSWNEFLGKNRGWIQLQEVSLSQARGEAEFSEAVVKTYRSAGQVVVAVCHQRPISMKAPKVEKANVARSEDEPVKPASLDPVIK